MDNFFINPSVSPSRNFAKGKSFNCSKWDQNVEYNNNQFVQDFVIYDNKLWACIANRSINSQPSIENPDWELVINGNVNEDLKTLELQSINGMIQYRHVGDSEWNTLIKFQAVSDDEIDELFFE